MSKKTVSEKFQRKAERFINLHYGQPKSFLSKKLAEVLKRVYREGVRKGASYD